ncbi:MAG: AI-2E family transporter [Acidobacteriia bacterium]|nr:AI-2E family transporter [Terriglobia bacterium]
MQRAEYGRITLLIILAIVLYFVFRILQPFLSALAWAAILATVFFPLYDRLLRRLRRPRLASGLACIVLTVAIVLPVLLLILLLAGESVGAYRMLEDRLKSGGLDHLTKFRDTGAYQWILARAHDLGLPEPNLSAAGIRALRAVSEFLVNHSASVLSGFTRFVVSFLIMLFSLYYLFIYGRQILSDLRDLIPLRPEHQEKIAEKFRAIARATFGGTLATALIQGTAGGLVFLIFGLPSPLLWGAVMSFLSLVPLVGTALVWGPVVIYYLLTGAIWKGVLLLVIFGGVVGSVDNVIKPLIIRRGVEINTLLIFLSVLGGVALFGFLGFVLGPFFVTVFLLLIDIYKAEFREELNATPDR